MAADQIDNDVYRRMGHAWWDDETGVFSSLRFLINPVRIGYFRRVLGGLESAGNCAAELLDIGCGGGVLAEEFARDGLRITGIDPAPESIAAARVHARQSGLAITYTIGCGEHLPFADESFDYVSCCDVLEHVEDPDRIVAEAARVLKPGGLLLYDTINRTWISKLVIIKLMQDWKSTAFVGPNTHVWDKFITPNELDQMFTRHGLRHGDRRGIDPAGNPVASWRAMRRRAKGLTTFPELGQALAFGETDGLDVSYLGYAQRPLETE